MESPMSQADQLTLSIQRSIGRYYKTTQNVEKAKSPGTDKVQNEHLIYGGRTLLQCLSNLYRALLTYSLQLHSISVENGHDSSNI